MKNKSYLLKYAIDYLSKFDTSKKNLARILKMKIQRATKDKKETVCPVLWSWRVAVRSFSNFQT